MNDDGKIFDIEKVAQQREKMIMQLRSQGDQRFFQVKNNVDIGLYDVKVFVTNEEVDKAVLVQNLISVFQTVAASPITGINPKDVLENIYDVMGLDVSQLKDGSRLPTIEEIMAKAKAGAGGAVPAPMPGGMPVPQPPQAAGQIPASQGAPRGVPSLPSLAGAQQQANTL